MNRIIAISTAFLLSLAASRGQSDPLTEEVLATLKTLPEAIAIAAGGGQFEVGKSYQFLGPVIQMTEEFLLVKNLITDQPLGILAFGDPKKVGNVSADEGTMIQAIIRFKQFKNILMANDTTKRMAVFDCIGFMPVGGKYVDTSAPDPADSGTQKPAQQ